MLERLDQFVGSAITALVGALIASVAYLVRVVFTNQKQLDALRKEIEHRDELRQKDSSRLEELHKDVRELREDYRRDKDS